MLKSLILMVGWKKSDKSIDYDVVIGLEIHAQLMIASKIFCGWSMRS